jgi:hypothetical protein
VQYSSTLLFRKVVIRELLFQSFSIFLHFISLYFPAHTAAHTGFVLLFHSYSGRLVSRIRPQDSSLDTLYFNTVELNLTLLTRKEILKKTRFLILLYQNLEDLRGLENPWNEPSIPKGLFKDF